MRKLQLIAIVGLTFLALACGRSDEAGEGEIETIDVVPGRTSLLTTAYDETAPVRQETFSGVLPSDFPSDLPLYDPSSLTDFGDAGGGRYVLMFTPDTATMVRDRMGSELTGTGWARIDGNTERGTYRRGSQSVIIEISDANPGTEIRVEY